MVENNQPNGQQEQNNNQNIWKQTNQVETRFNVNQEQPVKKKGKKGLIVFLLIIVLAILAVLAYYFLYYTKPEQVIKRTISTTMSSYKTEVENTNYNTSKTYFNVNAKIDTNSIYLDKNIVDLINKIDLSCNVQTSKEDKQLLVNLNSNYDNKSLINMQVFSDAKNEETYLYFKDLLNKYLEVELEDDFYSTVKELFETEETAQSQKENTEKALDIIEKEVLKIIKTEYCSSQKADIKVNNETVNTTKNTVKMTFAQLKNEFIELFNNLQNNQEFLNCYEENKEEVQKSLQQAIEQLQEINNEDASIEFSMYTEGLMQNAVKYDVTIYMQETMQSVTISITENTENQYYYEVALNNLLPILSGTISVEEKNEDEGIIKLAVNVQEFGTFELNIEYGQKFNEEIDKVDVNNSVNIEKISTSDQKTLMTNLQKSKLFELIEDFTGTSLIETTDDSDDKTTTTDKETEEKKEEDKKEEEETDEDKNEENKDEKDKKALTKDNEIISYNDKYKITFKVPSGYESRYVSENYRSLDKKDGNASIKVSTSRANKDEYYEELEETYKEYTENTKYKNVTLTKMETMEVGDKTFYTAILSYERTSDNYTYKNSTKYVWTEIANDYVMDIKISDYDEVTDEELKEVLTIDVKNI